MSRRAGKYDVIVVGAGAAGVGIGVALLHAGIKNFLLVDRYRVGASFERWPAEMRFITPSFPTNSIGMLDLNSVAIGTSPAHSLKVEHPTGREFAAYLRAVADHFKLPTKTSCNVRLLSGELGDWRLETSSGELRSRFLIWAAGEFQYPRLDPFPGAELCQHNARVRSWNEHRGDEAIVIGGYESGIDAAIHLARSGKRVTVLDRAAIWHNESSDPSTSLSTFTLERLRESEVAKNVRLASGADVAEVRRWGRGFEIKTADRDFRTKSQPILATGFSGSQSLIANHFTPREDGYPRLNDVDESTKLPGLFFVGPMVRQDQHVFCFIFKFRQRFAVVAKSIATRLELPAEQLETYRHWGMYLDDLSCCGEECVC